MSYIKVNNDKVTPEIAEKLIKLCPFNAFEYHNGYLSINSLCKVCKICVNKGPKDVCEFDDVPNILRYHGMHFY